MGSIANNIENFWRTPKRGILGIYSRISANHLQKYVDEFTFRYSNKDNNSTFNLLVNQAAL